MKRCVFFFAWFFNCNGMFCFWASTGILHFFTFSVRRRSFSLHGVGIAIILEIRGLFHFWYILYAWCWINSAKLVLCCHHILQNQQFEWQCGPLWVCRALVLMELLPLLCNVMRKCRRFIVILSFLIWWWLHIAQTIIQNATKGAL